MLVPPDVFLEYKGVIVYQAYKDRLPGGMCDYSYPLTYYYTTDLSEEKIFDIRGLDGYDTKKDHKQILMEAIENNVFFSAN